MKSDWRYKLLAVSMTVAMVVGQLPLWLWTPAVSAAAPDQSAAGTISELAVAAELPFTTIPGQVNDLARPQQAGPTEPTAIDNPISLSLDQSSHLGGGIYGITYTVRNNFGPVYRPQVAASESITNIVDAILTTDFSRDPNTIHGALLTVGITDTLTAVVDSSIPFDRDGQTLALNIGDIPPLGSRQITLTLSVPSIATNFRFLDEGADVFAEWRGRPVHSTSGPIKLVADEFSAHMICTLDANCDDPYIIHQAGLLDNDPIQIFEYVRDLDYESYNGSLRGARGTLWSQAGNGLDQASLLVALLRASGTPAVYRLGALDQAAAQILLSNMFPAGPPLGGFVPAGAATADPINDGDLLAEAQSHAWVESFLPGAGWTTLDPSFAAANPGDMFGTPTTGQMAEVPDNLRHKVSVQLTVEKYSAFPVGGSFLYEIRPLSATLRTVETVGEPLVFAHLVESSNPPGLVYSSAENNYIPYFAVGTRERLIEGTGFGELISSFPFGQDFVTAEWLDFTVIEPDGTRESFRRELFDDIGYEVRAGGGVVNDIARDGTPRVSLMSSWNTLFSVSDTSLEAINASYQDMIAASLKGIELREQIGAYDDSNTPSPAQTAFAQEAALAMGEISRLSQRLHLLKFASAVDQSHDYLGDATLVKAYADTAQIFTVGWERNEQSETDSLSFDMLRNQIRSLAYPGQTDIGLESFRFTRALVDLGLETEILKEIAPAPVTSVGTVFDQAVTDGLELVRITFGTLDTLATLPLSDESKARISTAITENPDLYILVPEAMVTLPGTLEPTVGWLAVDNVTLQTSDTMENGQHNALSQYAILGQFSKRVGSLVGGFSAGFFGYTMGFWIGFFEQMPLDGKSIGSVLSAAKASAKSWGKEAEKACNAKADKKWCKAGVGAGNAAGAAAISKADPPVQELYFNPPFDLPETQALATDTLLVGETIVGNSVVADLTTPQVAVRENWETSWTTTAEHGFLFDQLEISAADVYSGGILLESGPVLASGQAALAQSDGTALAVYQMITGTLTLHAPALDGLAAGSLLNHDTTLSAGGSYVLVVSGAEVTVGGTTTDSPVQIVTSSPAQLRGFAATAAPNFAVNAPITATVGGLMVAPATGTLTVGGLGANATNGFALGNADGVASINQVTEGEDGLVLSGSADFFALDLTDPTSTIDANEATSFTAGIEANFSDSYTLTVDGPDGWDITLVGGGVTAQSPIGAEAGDYTILVTAQSSTYPHLFVSAEHVVSVSAVDGIVVDVAPDPQFTVPVGPANSQDVSFDPQISRLQLTNAAFTTGITNTSSVARTFDVTVLGLPGGWALFAGQQGTSLTVDLDAGQRVDVTLFVSPTVAALASVGASFPFNVTATAQDNGSVTAADNDTFTMPGMPYPAITVDPPEIFASANSDVTFEATLTNIGNAPGNLNWTSSVAEPGWTVDSPASPVTLAPGASTTVELTVGVGTGQAGVDYPLVFESPVATLPYTPTTTLLVFVTSANSGPIYQSAEDVEQCTSELALSGAFDQLASSLNALDQSCQAGGCDTNAQNNGHAAAVALSDLLAGLYPAVDRAMFDAASGGLATAVGDVAIETAAADLSSATADLATAICQVAAYQPGLVFTPAMDAVLLGDSATYTLTLTNNGNIAGTYAVTATYPGGIWLDTPALNPGESLQTPLVVTPLALGYASLNAVAVATSAPFSQTISAQASAGLNVVDRYVDVLSVTPSPAFVETGVSSTTISAEIANIAALPLAATADVTVRAPSGFITYTTSVPLNIVTGDPVAYELGDINTSNWDRGVYTVSLALRCAGSLPCAPAGPLVNGQGYGLLAVGEGLVASQSAGPELVAPGTVSVTVGITTTVTADVFQSLMGPETIWEPTGLRNLPEGFVEESLPEEGLVVTRSGPEAQPGDLSITTPDENPIDDLTGEAADSPENVTSITEEDFDQPVAPTGSSESLDAIGRDENDSPSLIYTGTWTLENLTQASGGTVQRTTAAGDEVGFAFNGTWVGVGISAGNFSGEAEIFLDGASQGVIDLYTRFDVVRSFYFAGLAAGNHTVVVRALGTKNAFSNGTRVNIDFFDTWDGTNYPDGTYEQDDARLFLSNGWNNANNAAASGGSYYRGTTGTAWFPFTGDSLSLQSIAYVSGGMTRIYIDGHLQTIYAQYNPDVVTRTLSIDGLGAGPHVMQISHYRSNATFDSFTTPGSAPFYDDTPGPGVIRYEEDAPEILFNGVPYSQTSSAWSSHGTALSSDGYHHRATTSGNDVEFNFNGTWIGVGFAGGTFSGQAEIFIDGATQGVVDLYRNQNEPLSFYFDGLTDSAHTVRVDVLGTKNSRSGSTRVNIDYFDVWDGTAMTDDTIEFDFTEERVSGSKSGWSIFDLGAASEGSYLRGPNTAAWFRFTGDTVTLRNVAYPFAGKVKVYIDGRLQTPLNLYHPTAISNTLSFNNLGSGPHVMAVSSYRGILTLDTFTTPGVAPFYTPPTPTGIVRVEEDDPALLYNGLPYTATAQSWSLVSSAGSSDGYFMRSDTGGDSMSYSFNGPWVGIGFGAGSNSGLVDIAIDGVPQGTFDLYRSFNDTVSHYFDGLGAGPHTIAITVLGSSNPFAGNERVNLDFIDTWDGSTMSDGTFEAEMAPGGRVIRTSQWDVRSSVLAGDGTYLRSTIASPGADIWFPFTGDTVSMQYMTSALGGQIELRLDGRRVNQPYSYDTGVITRTLTLNNLGSGPHVLQVSSYRSNARVDNFTTPGTAPFFTPPTPTGLIRYEEDDPAIRYNGAPFTSTVQSWNVQNVNKASQGYAIRSDVLNDAVEFTFDGPWVSLGFVTASNNGLAEVRIDDVPQEIVDLYSPADDVLPRFYTGLGLGTHTIKVIVLDDKNAASSNTFVELDYIDAWDVTIEVAGWYEADLRYADNDQVDMSQDWTVLNNTGARGGEYYRDGSNAWFRFTGDSVTVRPITAVTADAALTVYIDGVLQGVYDLEYPLSVSPIPLHFTGLGPGPHVVWLQGNRPLIDAFEARPTAFELAPPMAEWWEITQVKPVINTIVAGDINEDGVVELVVTAADGELFVLRGDGQDAGGGTPILWSTDLGGEPDAAALGDLDGLPGAEIVVGSPDGLYAFHADGTLYWFTDTIKSTWKAINIANVDADPEPEIIATGNVNCPCVIEPDGSGILWRGTLAAPLTPNVADLTGDGRLDILTGKASTMYLYDMATIPATLAWSLTFTSTIDGRGTPAVADLDGHLPGGDDGPEIVVVADGFIHMVDAGGTIQWTYATGPGSPGGVSIADLTGDGEPDIIASAQVDGGRLYALTAEGALIWEAPGIDLTSANSVSVLDLDGDGVWEVVWNGFDQGLTIYDGATGTVLFNEPLINSQTRIDYPIIADVDGDGAAEIVANDNDGIYVVGWDPVWANSRPIWNQYNYAITNVNDDLSIPPNEPESWAIHNTYRTQTPMGIVLPVYDVAVNYTAAITSVMVLTQTFTISTTDAAPDYMWEYEQAWYEPLRSNHFDNLVLNMAPGEARRISEGALVEYTLPSGSNRLTLPPLYVAAAHIIALSPITQPVATGATAVFDVIVDNPLPTATTYTLTVDGLPAEWMAWPMTVAMGPGASLTLPLTVTVPETGSAGESLFSVAVETANGGRDQASGGLTVFEGLDVTISPANQSTDVGQSRAYTLTISNGLATAQVVNLSASGAPVDLPATVNLPGGGAVNLPVTATASFSGANLFTVQAVGDDGASDSDSGVLEGVGDRSVSVLIEPSLVSGGIGSILPYTVTVTNQGSGVETFALNVDVPSGWSYELSRNGASMNEVTVSPGYLNESSLTMLVQSPAGTLSGFYGITLTAQALGAPGVVGSDTAQASLTSLGVEVDIVPVILAPLSPLDTRQYQVTISNKGTLPDTFDLHAVGLFANVATFVPNSVTLNPGESTVVQLTTGPVPWAMPGTYGLTVKGTSTTDSQVFDLASLDVALSSYDGVNVAWQPAVQSVPGVQNVSYLLVVTNTGNINTEYDFNMTFGTLSGVQSLASVPLPPHQTTYISVTVTPPGTGIFFFDGAANSAGASDSATAELQVTVPTAVQFSEDATTETAAINLTLWMTLLLIMTLATGLYVHRSGDESRQLSWSRRMRRRRGG